MDDAFVLGMIYSSISWGGYIVFFDVPSSRAEERTRDTSADYTDRRSTISS